MHCSRNKYIVVGILMLAFLFMVTTAEAQCSICTRTAQQLGEKPAKGLNAGIMYLAFTPLLIIGFVAWKVIRKQNSKEA
jgi:hypothetical protein